MYQMLLNKQYGKPSLIPVVVAAAAGEEAAEPSLQVAGEEGVVAAVPALAPRWIAS